MKTLMFSCLIIAAMFVGGCTTIESILDIISPEPCPVCDSTTVGVHVNNQTCVKYDDGSYRWVPDSK